MALGLKLTLHCGSHVLHRVIKANIWQQIYFKHMINRKWRLLFRNLYCRQRKLKTKININDIIWIMVLGFYFCLLCLYILKSALIYSQHVNEHIIYGIDEWYLYLNYIHSYYFRDSLELAYICVCHYRISFLKERNRMDCKHQINIFLELEYLKQHPKTRAFKKIKATTYT